MTTPVIVHAGIHKTGSSAIQSALAANRSVLGDAGVRYPEALDERTGHHELAMAVRMKARGRGREIAEHYRAEFDRAAAAGATLVLSSEEFEYALGPDLLPALAAIVPGDVRVVLYVDRQDRVVERIYGQHVRAVGHGDERFSGPIEVFLARHPVENRLDYWRHVRAVEAALGPGSVEARVYDRSRFDGGDVVRDFLGLLSVDPATVDLDEVDVNPSLSGPGLEFVRRMNALGVDGRDRRRMLKRVRIVDEQGWSKARPLGADMRRALLTAFAESNESLFDWLGEPNPWTPDCIADEVDETDESEFDRYLVALLTFSPPGRDPAS